MKLLYRLRKLSISLGIAMGVTGCFSSNISSNEGKPVVYPIDKNEQLLLSIGEGSSYLYRSDYLRLEKFVRTAKPRETIQWRKYSMTYTLISHSTFLDEKARPCRRYQFKANSFLPFIKSIHCTETACRCTDGTWRKISEAGNPSL